MTEELKPIDINANRTKYCYRLGAFTVMLTGERPLQHGMTLCQPFRSELKSAWLVCMAENINKYQIHLDLEMIRKLKYPSAFFINCINDFMTIYDVNLKPFSDGVPASIQKLVVEQVMDDLSLKDSVND